jgi:hypothetical protein
MKKWELELMGVMSKSDVDHVQGDVIKFVNQLLTNIVKEVENTYGNDIESLGKGLRKEYIKD